MMICPQDNLTNKRAYGCIMHRHCTTTAKDKLIDIFYSQVDILNCDKKFFYTQADILNCDKKLSKDCLIKMLAYVRHQIILEHGFRIRPKVLIVIIFFMNSF